MLRSTKSEGTCDEKDITKAAKKISISYLIDIYEDIEFIKVGTPYEAPMGSITVDRTVNK